MKDLIGTRRGARWTFSMHSQAEQATPSEVKRILAEWETAAQEVLRRPVKCREFRALWSQLASEAQARTTAAPAAYSSFLSLSLSLSLSISADDQPAK
jgi:F0F1-type ATP synthase gamma subunit